MSENSDTLYRLRQCFHSVASGIDPDAAFSSFCFEHSGTFLYVSNLDCKKTKIVALLRQDYSNKSIAKLCDCSERYVRKVKAALSS